MILIENKDGSKKWDQCSPEEKIAYCDSLVEEAKSSREVREIEWYLNQMFIDGNHYASYNTVTNSLETRPKKKGEVRMVINITKSAIRSIKNYVTREEPKWDITPGDTDENTITNARRMGKTLDYIFRKLHLEQIIAGETESALNTSVGWIEIDWDPDAEGGLGQVKVILHDSFDVYCDPYSKLYNGLLVGRYIFKSIKRPTSSIKADKRYDEKTRKQVKSDDSLAESSIKARILQKEGNQESKNRSTIREFLLWDDEKNSKKGNIKIFTYSGKQVLRDEDSDLTEYPLYPLQVSLNPNKIYQRSWTADAIPINKAIDRVISQKIMYVNKALVFRLVADAGAISNYITNEHGEFIEVNKGRNFSQMPMQPLPSTIDSLLGELNDYHQDVLSAHDASTGSLPAGARSGKTLEALQAAESNNLSGLSQALRSHLCVIGKKILDVVAEKYVTSRIVKLSEPEKDEEGNSMNTLRVIGEGAPEEAKREDATIITGDNEMIVSIGSWLGYTREAQRETLLKLGELGIIPAEEILRQMEFANIEDLSAKAKEQRLEKNALDAEVAGRNQGQGNQPNPNEDMQNMADQENTQMINGEQLPPTEGADMNHSQAHIDFMKTQMFQSVPPNTQAIVQNHVKGELQMQGVGS
ncbi:MAG: hypothetical protein WC479_02860 [Candidatus Izemoplasmatales bacterium]